MEALFTDPGPLSIERVKGGRAHNHGEKEGRFATPLPNLVYERVRYKTGLPALRQAKIGNTN